MSRHVPALAIAAAVVLATMAGGAADQKNVEWRAYSGDKGSTQYLSARPDQQRHGQEPSHRLASVGDPEEVRPHAPTCGLRPTTRTRR